MARRSLAPRPAVPVAQLTILLNIAAAVKVAGSGDPPSRRAGLAGVGPPPLKQTRLPPLPHTAPQIFKNPFDDFSGGKTFCKAATRHTPPSTSGGFYPALRPRRRRGRARLCMRRARGSRKAAAPHTFPESWCRRGVPLGEESGCWVRFMGVQLVDTVVVIVAMFSRVSKDDARLGGAVAESSLRHYRVTACRRAEGEAAVPAWPGTSVP